VAGAISGLPHGTRLPPIRSRRSSTRRRATSSQCRAGVGRKGRGDDHAHGHDRACRLDYDNGARRTSARAKDRPMPIGLSRERWLLRPNDGAGTCRDPQARAVLVKLDVIGQLLHRHAQALRLPAMIWRACLRGINNRLSYRVGSVVATIVATWNIYRDFIKRDRVLVEAGFHIWSVTQNKVFFLKVLNSTS